MGRNEIKESGVKSPESGGWSWESGVKSPDQVSIKENSWIARIAAKKLKSSTVAIVIGNTIHLHNTTKSDFLLNEKWVKHELCHIAQYRQYGTFNFIIMYLWESLKNGYFKNKFEEAARRAEIS
jgi:hypothetical protein